MRGSVDGRHKVHAVQRVIAVTVGFGVEPVIVNGGIGERDFLHATDIRANQAAFRRERIPGVEGHIAERSLEFLLCERGEIGDAERRSFPCPDAVRNFRRLIVRGRLRIGGRIGVCRSIRGRVRIRRDVCGRIIRGRLYGRRVRGCGGRLDGGRVRRCRGRLVSVRRRGRAVRGRGGRNAAGFRPVDLNDQRARIAFRASKDVEWQPDKIPSALIGGDERHAADGVGPVTAGGIIEIRIFEHIRTELLLVPALKIVIDGAVISIVGTVGLEGEIAEGVVGRGAVLEEGKEVFPLKGELFPRRDMPCQVHDGGRTRGCDNGRALYGNAQLPLAGFRIARGGERHIDRAALRLTVCDKRQALYRIGAIEIRAVIEAELAQRVAREGHFVFGLIVMVQDAVGRFQGRVRLEGDITEGIVLAIGVEEGAEIVGVQRDGSPGGYRVEHIRRVGNASRARDKGVSVGFRRRRGVGGRKRP